MPAVSFGRNKMKRAMLNEEQEDDGQSFHLMTENFIRSYISNSKIHIERVN